MSSVVIVEMYSPSAEDGSTITSEIITSESVSTRAISGIC